MKDLVERIEDRLSMHVGLPDEKQPEHALLREAVDLLRMKQNLTDEVTRLRDVEQAAHDLLCWTHQDAINVEPKDYSSNIRDLHPGVYNRLNAAEKRLFGALLRADYARAKVV